MKDPVLITGARGFVGRALAARLREMRLEVHGTTRRGGCAESDQIVTFHTVAEDSPAAWVRVVEAVSPGTVFHLGAGVERLVSPAASASYIASTLSAAANLLEALGGRLASAVVLLGSGEEYGAAPVPYREDSAERPLTSYGLAKLAVTALGRQVRSSLGLPIVTVRPAVVYGPGQPDSSFLNQLLLAAVGGSRAKMTPGEQTRDFVHVADLVNALILVSDAADRVDVVNVGSGVEISLRAVANLIGRMTGRPVPADFGALPYREGDPMRYVMDASRIQELLGWRPGISLEQGLRLLLEAVPDG